MRCYRAKKENYKKSLDINFVPQIIRQFFVFIQWGYAVKTLRVLRKESTFEGLVEALKSNLAPFSRHLFHAKWQYQQYA